MSAILAGPNISRTGTIIFTYFDQGNATDCTTGGTEVGTAIVSDGPYNSSFSPTYRGDYWWYASYSGCANNGATDSVCGSGMPETAVY
jgi:hypothetical protein